MDCETVKELYNMHVRCCMSCHEDVDIGYGEDLYFKLGIDFYHVCCAVANSFDRKKAKLDISK